MTNVHSLQEVENKACGLDWNIGSGGLLAKVGDSIV